MAQQRIKKVISQSRKEVERVLPKIFKGVIKGVYQTENNN